MLGDSSWKILHFLKQVRSLRPGSDELYLHSDTSFIWHWSYTVSRYHRYVLLKGDSANSLNRNKWFCEEWNLRALPSCQERVVEIISPVLHDIGSHLESMFCDQWGRNWSAVQRSRTGPNIIFKAVGIVPGSKWAQNMKVESHPVILQVFPISHTALSEINAHSQRSARLQPVNLIMISPLRAWCCKSHRTSARLCGSDKHPSHRTTTVPLCFRVALCTEQRPTHSRASKNQVWFSQIVAAFYTDGASLLCVQGT